MNYYRRSYDRMKRHRRNYGWLCCCSGGYLRRMTGYHRMTENHRKTGYCWKIGRLMSCGCLHCFVSFVLYSLTFARRYGGM